MPHDPIVMIKKTNKVTLAPLVNLVAPLLTGKKDIISVVKLNQAKNIKNEVTTLSNMLNSLAHGA